MLDPKRDIPKEAFQIETKGRINIENEVMRKIDEVEVKKVKPLGVKPQMMGFIMGSFFFLMALIGVLAESTTSFEGFSINGFELRDYFGKIPVEFHFTVLFLAGGLLIYMMIQSILDTSKARIKS